MNKLEVGMYVRFENVINKIIEIDEEYLVFDMNWYDHWADEVSSMKYDLFMKEYNPRYSYNIIDLIEVGDVIIDKEGHKYPINYEFETDYNNEYGSYEITIDDNITLFFKDGLSIVTKEQFKSMEYRLGE